MDSTFKSYPRLRKKPYWGNYFWAKGYSVNTARGMDEDVTRRYVKYQEGEERKRERQRSGYDLFS